MLLLERKIAIRLGDFINKIRLQFSLSKNPIVNDIKFNKKESNGLLGLRAYSIKFWYDKKFYNFKLPLKETLKSFDF